MAAGDEDLKQLLARIKDCRAELRGIGIVLRGSVTKRYMPCGKKGCRCQAEPPRLHGPYYQWTRKVKGKTQTVRLKPDEASVYSDWIASRQRLEQIIARWEAIGIEAAQLIREKSRR